MSVQKLLERLRRVHQRSVSQKLGAERQQSNGETLASVTVEAMPDGLALIRCANDQDGETIIQVTGVRWHDLIAEPSGRIEIATKTRLGLSGQALEVLSREALFVYFCAGDLAIGKPLSDDARERLLKALSRIRAIQRGWQP